ncbi:MAG: Gfo/Idh/MocA family oxidoreductase [Candidatus Omnitrophota bacterium]
MEEIRAGIIGLDTSHTIEFTRRLQAPDCPPDQRVEGMNVISCLRFPSPFQSEPDQDKRQEQLEQWGVKVSGKLEEVLNGTDVFLLEINDPSLHLDYFKKVMDAGKPIFLDKPPADTLKNAQDIFRLAREKNLKLFSASSLRFAPQVIQLPREIPQPKIGGALGPLGKAPAGSSIVWYGIHTVEMIQAVMGTGAKKVFGRRDPMGISGIIEYGDGRRATIQLNEGIWHYAVLGLNDKVIKFLPVDASRLYTDLLKKIVEFFRGGEPPVSFEESLEVQAILEAIEKSVNTGREQSL